MLLSVIIPSYQHAEYVISCILAAIEIPIQSKEIFVIDDGSSDNSPELLRTWVAAHPTIDCVHLVFHENRGLVSVLNEGLAAARGSYVYIVASDDVPMPAGIGLLLQDLERNPNAKFAMGNARAFLGDVNNPTKAWRTYGDSHQHFFNLSPIKRNSEIFLNYPVPILIQASVFKKEALLSVGGWSAELAWDDFPLFVKLFNLYPKKNIDFIYSPDSLIVNYRQHENNSYRNLRKQVAIIVQSLELLCPADLKAKAISRVYVRFSISAVKQMELLYVVELIKMSLMTSGFKVTASQLLLSIWQLLGSRFLTLIKRSK